MKASKLFSTFSLIILCAGSAGAAALFPVVTDGRWGFASASGKMVTNPQFEAAEFFSENLAAVELG